MLIYFLYSNARGIPQAPFVEKVEQFVPDPEQVEHVIQQFQEMLS